MKINKEFSPKRRSEILSQIEDHEYDLVIIGGGITGAGAARDAASRGMKVLLLEKDDFAQGTSSRSSKLIHGGIRYLENLEFGLVFEALSERRLLFEIAPHLVHPLKFILPLYEGGRVGMFKMGLGMWAYDALALFEAPEMHERLSVAESLEKLPFLKGESLLGAYSYYDAYMDDDRLVIETLRSASQWGAQSVNFVEALDPIWSDERMVGLMCKDQIEGKIFKIRARHILSCVGPWTDHVGQRLLPKWKKIMRPSKGIHLTLRRDRLPLQDAVVMAADSEKRIVFGIPRHEMIIIGTTDTDFNADPGDVCSNADDVKYLLKIVNDYFPEAHLAEEDIIASYSGVRPLVSDGSASESATSREHVIFSDRAGVTFVAGGKYTTYRAMAEQCIQEVLSFASIESQMHFRRSQTQMPLNPKATKEVFQQQEHFIARLIEEFEISRPIARLLFERHGLEAEDLARKLVLRRGLRPEDSERLHFWQAEAEHAIEQTMCLRLVDFYLRRTPLFLSEPDHGFTFIQALGEVFAQKLNLNEHQLKQQIDALHSYLKFEMGWR